MSALLVASALHFVILSVHMIVCYFVTILGECCQVDHFVLLCSIWCFLICLSALMFFGVLFVDNGSPIMDFTMCLLATLSITCSLFVISEMDDTMPDQVITSARPGP